MRFYNSLTRTKEEFKPIHENRVNMYVCGITAYDYCHIGHARSAVVFDVIVRYLRARGYEVVFARNFTDVDDKIINRANEVGASSHDIAEKFMAAFHEDMDALGVLRADLEPKATDHIGDMIELTQNLMNKGFAYTTLSGDVYYRVRAFADYGKLSNRNLDDLRAGARIAPDEGKEDPLDFALWKAAKPGEPSWDSPWGKGRPGWHTECSAMSENLLELPLDIHGGGQDLIFPHHENEIAQSEAATGKDFVHFWVHNGFVQIDSEKMSKSLGNFKTIRDIYESYLPETLRYFLLTKHYRSPIDFTFDSMDEAEKNLRRVYTVLADVEEELTREKRKKSPLPEDFSRELEEAVTGFAESMEDDCNTAGAIGHVFGAVKVVGRLLDDAKLRKTEDAKAVFERFSQIMQEMGGVLGLFGQNPRTFLEDLKAKRLTRRNVDVAEVEKLVAQRTEAKKSKDFETADSIRDSLTQMGVEVRDTPQGPVWDML
ncbi:cysteine--tRNA ligase [Oceanidesulfovibrio marinus]|uniref:Cysteine--tRNA ligase n=1 Tax=Oceanidesulfovibrio marinus TaxID=370038 RepID=A0ABX6NER0_9BACT|nr:cysteine--tRNA ligase [Oceanidesulfovibrio marinus]QJT08240.1 cysteine--tRNA ligase [Oceanidesulfovibrio marinus]